MLDGLSVLDRLSLCEENQQEVVGCVPAHEQLLDSAIANISDKQFTKLKRALHTAKEQLRWRVDDGGFYSGDADVGDGYKTGNMHALLVGPEGCPFVADDFLLGFFLLTPQTLYRDHKHLAPEIYMPLTGPHGWRFGLGGWHDHEAGRVIYNAPNDVHATRVYGTPFLALFVWPKNIDTECCVVFADDWAKIEAGL